jgi:hypothetical protein
VIFTGGEFPSSETISAVYPDSERWPLVRSVAWRTALPCSRAFLLRVGDVLHPRAEAARTGGSIFQGWTSL